MNPTVSHKYLYITLSIVALVAYSFIAYAAVVPGVDVQFNPGQELSPQCSPTDTNCKVAVAWLTDQVNGYVYSDNALHNNALIFGDNDMTWSSGVESKMFFDRQKNAFRVGSVDNTNWDASNVGVGSIAMGSAYPLGNIHAPKASGMFSVAVGTGVVASGDMATALGYGTFARSYGETTLGLFSTDYAPQDAVAYNAADRLFTIGNGTGLGGESDALTILKNGNTAIGVNTWESDGDASSVKLKVNGSLYVGTGTATYTGGSTVEGKMFFDPVKYAFRGGAVDNTDWDASNVGVGSFAFGTGGSGFHAPKASGQGSFALGTAAVASGPVSYALGFNANASGPLSFAIGSNSIASATRALAFSGGNASATGAFAVGSIATASNTDAVAFRVLHQVKIHLLLVLVVSHLQLDHLL
jgi:hypothetical protein